MCEQSQAGSNERPLEVTLDSLHQVVKIPEAPNSDPSADDRGSQKTAKTHQYRQMQSAQQSDPVGLASHGQLFMAGPLDQSLQPPAGDDVARLPWLMPRL